jgi:phosphohistidine phosphatase
MTQVYLMRHGEAEHRADFDAQRRLTERGLLQVRANVAKLPLLDPIAIYHSPLIRAQQSAALLQPYLNCTSLSCVERLKPDTAVLDAVGEILTLPAELVLLVSHNPLLEALSAELASVDLGTYTFSTGTLHSINLNTK